MYALTNCTIYTNDSVLTEHCVIVDGEYIHDLVTLADCPADITRIDLAGANLTAGFIDLQLNGCGGVLFNTDISINMHARTPMTIRVIKLNTGTCNVPAGHHRRYKKHLTLGI